VLRRPRPGNRLGPRSVLAVMRSETRPLRLLLAASLMVAFIVALAPAAVAGRSDRIVWVALEGAGKLAKVDLEEGVLRRLDTRGGGPHNITVAPDGTVVAALRASDRIVIVRDGERTFVDLGGAPHDVKIARNMVVVASGCSSCGSTARWYGGSC